MAEIPGVIKNGYQQHNYSGDPTLIDVSSVARPSFFTEEELDRPPATESIEGSQSKSTEIIDVWTAPQSKQIHNYSADAYWVKISSLNEPISE